MNPLHKTELVCPIKLSESVGPVLVSVSGGSDSDIVVDLVERHKGNADIKYVWYDTGLEYEATKKHLCYLEARYGIKIERIGAMVPIPISCKKHGVPFLSKRVSIYMNRLQKHGFKWEDGKYEELSKKYKNCNSALKWWCGVWGGSISISSIAYLKEFIMENPPNFAISDYCCTGSKKMPAKYAIKKYGATLNISGERMAEGGIRAQTIKSCFTPASDSNVARYRPIFFFSDKDKQTYVQNHSIKHSDCYAIYGMKRTGCAACPFGSGFEEDLKTIEKFEPKLFKAANAVFEKSYEYTRKYRQYKEKRKKEAAVLRRQFRGQMKGQIALF